MTPLPEPMLTNCKLEQTSFKFKALYNIFIQKYIPNCRLQNFGQLHSKKVLGAVDSITGLINHRSKQHSTSNTFIDLIGYFPHKSQRFSNNATPNSVTQMIFPTYLLSIKILAYMNMQLNWKVSRLRLRKMRVLKYHVKNKALFETRK